MNSEQLKKLNDSITKYVPPQGPRGVGYTQEKRKLSPIEWNTIKKDLRENKFVVTLCSTGFGFTMGIAIFEAPADPPYPGIPYDEPECLIVICQKQIPVPALQEATLGTPRAAYEYLRPLVDNPANLALIKRFGLDEPQSLDHYSY